MLIYLTNHGVESRGRIEDIDAFSNGKRCGSTTLRSRQSHRMLGGRNAGPGMFPSHVSVQINPRSACGGVLIHDNLVLTAKHCILDQSFGFTVGLGLDRYGYVGGTRVGVERICGLDLSNKHFDPYKTIDIVVLKLSQRVRYNGNIYPACIPIEPMRNSDFFAIGTGMRYEGNFGSNPLGYIRLENKCSTGLENFIGDTPYSCYSSISEPGIHLCPGDSGSGIYSHFRVGSQLVQFVNGIASHMTNLKGEKGEICATNPSTISVFADIVKSRGSLRSFIESCM